MVWCLGVLLLGRVSDFSDDFIGDDFFASFHGQAHGVSGEIHDDSSVSLGVDLEGLEGIGQEEFRIGCRDLESKLDEILDIVFGEILHGKAHCDSGFDGCVDVQFEHPV